MADTPFDTTATNQLKLFDEWTAISWQCSVKALGRLGQCSKAFAGLTAQDQVWERHYVRDFGLEPPPPPAHSWKEKYRARWQKDFRRMSTRRLRKEENQLREVGLPPRFSASPKDGSYLAWQACVPGPAKSPYEGGEFDLEIQYGTNYPFVPPKIKFLTKIYHPSIDDSGYLCHLAYLNSDWHASFTVIWLLPYLAGVMASPKEDADGNAPIYEEWRENRALFERKARESTLHHAIKPPQPSTK